MCAWESELWRGALHLTTVRAMISVAPAFFIPVVTSASDLVHDSRFDRTAVYDALYSKGYQVQSLNYSQSHLLLPVVHTLMNESKGDWELKTALDVGCSHGYAVTKLWELGLQASGIDLSNVAIDIARQTRPDEMELRCVAPFPGRNRSCFQQGSVADLPWANRSFDLTMSSDVLEHVPPALTDFAVAEMSRVTRKVSTAGDYD